MNEANNIAASTQPLQDAEASEAEGWAELLGLRCGVDFDGECHLSADEALRIASTLRELAAEKAEAEAQLAALKGEPVKMILFCPACGEQHIDEPDARTPGWTNPPHRSHLCHGCGHIWRPADVPTEGVAAITTRGQNDSPSVPPHKPEAVSDISRAEQEPSSPAPADRAALRERVAYAAERIILRRLHDKRIDGYTLPISQEIADAILDLLPPGVGEAVAWTVRSASGHYEWDMTRQDREWVLNHSLPTDEVVALYALPSPQKDATAGDAAP